MRNSSHTHTHVHTDTNAHSRVCGGYKSGIGSGNDIMTQAVVNTLDWWTARAAKRVGVCVGGPPSLARDLPEQD